MGQFGEQLAQQMATGGIGTILGMALGGYNDERQRRQQQELQNMQIAGNKEMMNYSMMKQFEMWQKTNYAAQIAELKKAGMSPGLLYGKGGPGGITGSPGGGVSGASAPVGGGEVPQMMGMALQLELLKAQKENIEADTANKKGDAANKPLVGQNLQASTGQMLANTGNIQADTELKKIQTNIAKIDEWIKGKTAEDQVEIAMWQSEKILNEVAILARQNILDAATMNDKIDTIKAELAAKALMPELIKAQTKTEQGKPALQQQEIKESQQRVEQMIRQGIQKWRELEIAGQNANTQQAAQVHNEWVNDMQSSTRLPIDLVEKAAQAIIFKNLLSPDTKTPIRGFHNR